MWRRRWARTISVEEERPDPLAEVMRKQPVLSELVEPASEQEGHVGSHEVGQEANSVRGVAPEGLQQQQQPDGIAGEMGATMGAVSDHAAVHQQRRDDVVASAERLLQSATGQLDPQAASPVSSLGAQRVGGAVSADQNMASAAAGPLTADPPPLPVLTRGVAGLYVKPAGVQ